MAIVFFPEQIAKRAGHVAERNNGQRSVLTVSNSKDITSAGIADTISFNSDWQMDNISFTFSAATARTFGVNLLTGRQVIAGYNDYLWFQKANTTTAPQLITLTPGFYTGATLATELKTQLDATFTGTTFTVSYTSPDFTITMSGSAQLRFILRNTTQALRWRQSLAGHLFGFTETSAYSASLTGDTAVPGLNTSVPIIALTGNTSLAYADTTQRALSLDNALEVTTGTAAITVGYTLAYERIGQIYDSIGVATTSEQQNIL